MHMGKRSEQHRHYEADSDALKHNISLQKQVFITDYNLMLLTCSLPAYKYIILENQPKSSSFHVF